MFLFYIWFFVKNENQGNVKICRVRLCHLFYKQHFFVSPWFSWDSKMDEKIFRFHIVPFFFKKWVLCSTLKKCGQLLQFPVFREKSLFSFKQFLALFEFKLKFFLHYLKDWWNFYQKYSYDIQKWFCKKNFDFESIVSEILMFFLKFNYF